jgi:hypothetical protein
VLRYAHRVRHLAFACAFGAALLTSPLALANGRFPASNQLVVSPSDPTFMVLRTTFGMLVSHDRGSTWDWICESAYGVRSGIEDPAIAITAGGTVFAATFEGLEIAPDQGCSFSRNPDLPNEYFVDIAERRNAPHSIVAILSQFQLDAGIDGGGYASQIYESTDDGAHFNALGPPIDPSLYLSSIEVAASDPQRLYVAGYRGTSPNRQALLLVSTDSGAHFTEHAVPIDPTLEVDVFIAAVDPTNADRIYLRSSGAQSRLFFTSDGGKGFAIPSLTLGVPLPDGGISSERMTGFALSQDGSKVYWGGMLSGLYVANRTDMVFTQVSKIAVQCLRTEGTTLFACSDEKSGFILGASDNDGATFTPLLHLDGVHALLSCPPSSPVQACAGGDGGFDTMCCNLGGCSGYCAASQCNCACASPCTSPCTPECASGGGDAGGNDGGAPPAPPKSTSCSCEVVGSDAPAIAGGAVAALGIAANAARRKSRHRSASGRH